MIQWFAAPRLLPALHAANLVNASPAEAPDAYFRERGRAAPHNLYTHPRRLPGGAVAPAVPALRFGPVGEPGAVSNRHDVGFRAARFTFAWAADTKRWLVSMDGVPMMSTESGQLSAATVVEQRVEVGGSESIEDAARTVGQGRATVLRDGQRFDATWTRPAAPAPTVFHAGSGAPMPLAPGPVWILLVPA